MRKNPLNPLNGFEYKGGNRKSTQKRAKLPHELAASLSSTLHLATTLLTYFVALLQPEPLKCLLPSALR